MSGPRLTPALAALRAGYDRLSPGRDRASDGWIGDAAHRARRSSHNPDDTPGSLSEYTDADSTPDVRGLDVDVDLVGPVTMQATIDRILATPADRRRLSYVIFNRRIASAKSGWVWRAYTGTDPHTGHAHFSGNPDYDDDDRPWSIADMEGDAMTTAEQQAAPWQYAGRGMPGVPEGKSTLWVLGMIYSTATTTARKVDALAAVASGQATADWLRDRFDQLGRQVDLVDDRVVDQLAKGDPVAGDPDQLVDALDAAGVDLDQLANAILARRTTPTAAAVDQGDDLAADLLDHPDAGPVDQPVTQ